MAGMVRKPDGGQFRRWALQGGMASLGEKGRGKPDCGFALLRILEEDMA